MIEALTISGKPPDDPVLDWSALVEEGRATLAAMSDGRWTDFNAHDPGITILELVAYALTDLGYRTGHPMADLMAGATPLPGPAASLTTRAVTLADMRRLGLDVAGARNVWIEPAASPGVRLRHTPGAREILFDDGPSDGSEAVVLKGVHRVLIEKSSREDLGGSDLARAVALRLHAERGLGEDFDSFTVLEPQPIVVVADVEIDDPARAEAILLEIFGRLDGYMSPQPDRATVAALRQSGQASDAIYDGPQLERGVTAGPADPQGRRRVLHLSDVIAELAATAGVRATRRVRLGSDLAQADAGQPAWSLAVAEDRVPAFDLQASRIRLLSAGAVALDSTARPDLAQRFSDALRAAQPSPAAMRDDPPPPGRDRGLARYRPLRLDLPRVYGVAPGSLGHGATSQRRAAANQLRAYLAILDALLAGGFAQLAGAAELLGGRIGKGRSYFAPAPEAAGDEAPVLSAGLTDKAMQELVEPAGAGARARRARFLDHLLARFGETVPAVPQPLGVGFGGDRSPADVLALRAREAFLEGLSRLSGGRGCGADLLADGEDSPLLDRIRLKLALPPTAVGRVLLVEHILLRGLADDQPAAQPLLAAAPRADPYSLQVSFIVDERLKALPGDAEAIARVIREECPAHLIAYVRWLPAEAFDAFAADHARWLAALRRLRREAVGLPEP
ncbi:MAG: hypothetical protein ABW203_04615 [Novosphingobium sp.]